jgi:hypothetical protein
MSEVDIIMSDSETSNKTPAGKPAKARILWRDVLRVVQDDSTRQSLVMTLRVSGFDPDSFARLTKPRQIVTDFLTRLEGEIEMRAIDVGGRGKKAERLTAARLAIRYVRRPLEIEVYP